MEKKVKTRVELMDAAIVPLTEILMSERHITFRKYGTKNQNDSGFYTSIHAVAQYLWINGANSQDMHYLLYVQNNNLKKLYGIYPHGEFYGDGSHFWMYMINDSYPTPVGSRYG